MDLSADAAFANNTRPGTPVASAPSAEASTSAGSSKLDRRDSSSTIRPELTDKDKGKGDGQESDDTVRTEAERAQAKAAGLEQEVGQVVQQLSTWGGSFWGGFRKQVSARMLGCLAGKRIKTMPPCIHCRPTPLWMRSAKTLPGPSPRHRMRSRCFRPKPHLSRSTSRISI